jgi:hypothetical protein
MKNLFQFSNQVSNEEKSFSNFSANEILSAKSMNRVRGGGGDGGGSVILPPPHP